MTTRSTTRPSLGARLACVTAIVAVMAWGMFADGTALAQTATQQATFRAKALEVHNADRAKYPIAALSLAPDTDVLNTGSEEWARHMATNNDFNHSPAAQRSGAGENIFVDYSTDNLGPAIVAKDAVDSWYGEVGSFSYAAPEAHKDQTGHFTQVVWKSTTTVGCGYATGSFTDPTTMNIFNAFYAVCRYTPAGNVAGEYGTNVLLPTPGVNPM